MKSSSDVVGAVLRELRLQSGGAEEAEAGFRLAVVVDGVNALWGRTTLKKEDKSPVRMHSSALAGSSETLFPVDWSVGSLSLFLSLSGGFR